MRRFLETAVSQSALEAHDVIVIGKFLKDLPHGMTLNQALIEAHAPKPRGGPRVSMEPLHGPTAEARGELPSPLLNRTKRNRSSTASRRQSGIYTAGTLFGHEGAEDGLSDGGADVESIAHSRRENQEPDLFRALPPLTDEASFAASHMYTTEEGRDQQRRLREKMILAALTSLPVFNDKPEEWVEWRDKVVASFKAAGRVAVLRPDFLEWAKDEGMPQVEIDETENWAHAILASAIEGCDDAEDAFSQAPAGKGSEGFCYMRRHFEIQGSHIKEKLRKQIEAFAPVVGENPVAMGRRLTKLYKRYAGTTNPEAQSEESKIRRLLAGAFMFEALEVKVRMIRSEMTGGRRPPRERTFKLLQEEINAEWTSFGAEENDVKNHAVVLAGTPRGHHLGTGIS
jgi:hypothetical protein